MKPAPATAVRPTHVRHVVLGITVAIYMITYMDRVILSTALPVMRTELGFSLMTAGWILSSFRWAYALFQIPGGWMGDRIGPRRALTLIVSWWSVFTVLTGLAWNAAAMIVTQLFFGMGEAGAFPIATRSLSRWMLPGERGHAQGVTHAGSRLGAAFTRPLAVFLIAAYGWRSPFFAFGGLGLLWAVVWFTYYRDTPDEHRGVNAQEREMIHAATGGPRSKAGTPVPWHKILSSPTLWALCAMYGCYQYGLVVYLDWFPTYLKEGRGLSLAQMGFYSSLPLFAGVIGDLGGGWLTDLLYRRTGNLRSSRRMVAVAGFIIAAAAIVPVTLVASPQLCVALSCLALGALELTVGVSWAIPLDIAGDFAGSAASVMNMVGNIGGAITPTVAAYLAMRYGWNMAFMTGSVLCVAGAAIHFKIDASKRIFG